VFNRCAEGFYKDIVPLIDKISRKELYEKFKKRYELWLGKFSTKKFMGEKTGEYLLHLDMIDSFYPDIKKVCIIRNPKDRIVSFHFHQLRKGKKTEKEITNKFILDYIHDRAIKDYEALIDYSGNIFCLTYEQLSGETRTTMMSILNYLGVEDLSDSIIERMVEEGSFSNLTKKDKLLPSDSGRQLGEENRNSHYRKGVVGDWKNHLSDSQSVLIDAKLKDLELKVYNKYKLKIYE